MAINTNSPIRISLATAALLAAVFTLRAAGQSAPAAVPVPITTALVGDGVAPLATNTCSNGILATNGSAYGDGCVAAQGLLSSPQGAAVDSYGDVFVADYSDRLVRVVYNGGPAIAALITAANCGYTISATRSAPFTCTPTPAPQLVVGDIYTIAGFGGSTTVALSNTDSSGKYVCANYVTAGQPEALNSLGDGCPAASVPIGPRDVALDAAGNLFLTDYTNSRIRVLCVSCTAGSLAAQLIKLENPGVTPVNGAMYTVAGFSTGYRDGPGFGGATSAGSTTVSSTVALLRSPVQAVVSSADDVYIADNLNNAVRLLYNGGAVANAILTAEGYTGATAPVVGNVYTIVGAGCVQAPVLSSGSSTSYECLTVKPGSPYTPETVAIGNNAATGIVWSLYLDANNNLYYTSDPDTTNDRVKVLYGGVAAPLTFPNATYTAALKTGYVYSFAGQGTLTQSGVAPSALTLNSAQSIGGDANGNLFFFDYGTGLLYETYAQTGLTAIIAGGNAIAGPAASAYCNGGTTGPQMVDAFYNGCPATQVKFTSPRGPVVADSNGNLYFGDSVGYFLRKFSYNPTFAATAAGASGATQPYAFTFLSAQTLTAPTLTDSADYKDVGSDTCVSGLAAVGGGPGTTCVVTIKFTPSTIGLRPGGVVLSSATATLGGSLFSGIGTGSGLAVDPGTSTTTGSGYTPNGIAVDGGGRVYFTDTTSKSVIRYNGSTASTVATGFTLPTGVAVDGIGDVFVADATANTITEVPIAGTKFTVSTGVSSPHGLATDGLGRLYVADTGNNRVLIFGPGASVPTIAAFTGLTTPQAVAVDLSGNLYVVDSSHVVKLTSAGVQTTVATTGGTGLAVDPAGNVLLTTGTTLVEYPANGGTSATLNSALTTPKGVALDGAGDAYIADNGYAGYLELQRTAAYYKFISNPAPSINVELSSIGTAAVSTTAYTQSDSVDYTLVPATTNGCSGALAAGSICALTVTFNPKNSGVVTDNVNFTAAVSNGSPTLTLTTISLTPAISVQASPQTLTYGNPVTLTATVYGPNNTSGTVIFYSNGTLLTSAQVQPTAMASYTYTPVVGVYTITATFTPQGASAPTVNSNLTPITVTVKQATPTVGVGVNAASGFTTTSVTITGTVTATGGTPTGSVTFFAGTTNLGTVALNGSTAQLTLTGLPVGNDCITADYLGDNNYVTQTSSCAYIVVAPGFGVSAASASLAFQQNYQEAQTYLTINPGGRTDTLTFACQGLPAKISCAFTPATLALTGLTTAQNIQLLVSNSGAQASLHERPARSGYSTRIIALALLPMALLLLPAVRRRRLPMLMLLAFMTLGAAAALNGCGASPTAVEQAPGTYPFTVTVNSGSTTLQTLNFTLTIPNQ